MRRSDIWRRSTTLMPPFVLLEGRGIVAGVLDSSVLVLNRHYSPVNLTTARRAFCMLFRAHRSRLSRRPSIMSGFMSSL